MISLSYELHDVLVDFADANETPVSTAIVALLEEMKPQLADLAKAIRHARDGKKAAAKRALQHMMGNAFAELVMEQRELPLRGKP
jgi:hypothetical protein